MTVKELRDKLNEKIANGKENDTITVIIMTKSVEIVGKGVLKIKNKSGDIDKIHIT